MSSEYRTRVTFIKGSGYHCRVIRSADNHVLIEGVCEQRGDIGFVFRHMFRDLDKLGGNPFTAAVRSRMFREKYPRKAVGNWYYRFMFPSPPVVDHHE